MTIYTTNGRAPVVRVPVGNVRVADPLTALERQMNRLFEDYKVPETGAPAHRLGATDITENAADYVVATEVPGCAESDIKLSTANGVLSVTLPKKAESKPAERHIAINAG